MNDLDKIEAAAKAAHERNGPMSTKQEWLDLADRCEKATWPDRDIDAALAARVFEARTSRPTFRVGDGGFVITASNTEPRPGVGDYRYAKEYTRSPGDIITLIEREFTPNWKLDRNCGGSTGFILIDLGWVESPECDTPALALCAAFCRAKAALETI